MTITKEDVIEICKTYQDPELMIDVWTLGLVYKVEVNDEGDVYLLITFTSPMCPFGPEMVEDLKQIIKYKGAKSVDIDVTFEPAWKAPEELRDMLGL